MSRSVQLQIAEAGRKYVIGSLVARGWILNDLESLNPTHPNIDLEATRNGIIRKIQVRSKEHREKVRLADSRQPGPRFFNRVSDAPKADFVICVRCWGNDREAFVFEVREAEEIANWFAGQFAPAGKNPRQPIELYVSHRRRKTSFHWNSDGHKYDRFREAWHLLD
jgi:hypothetical protein